MILAAGRRVPGTTRLRRVVFGVTPKTAFRKLLRIEKYGNSGDKSSGATPELARVPRALPILVSEFGLNKPVAVTRRARSDAYFKRVGENRQIRAIHVGFWIEPKNLKKDIALEG